MACKSDLTGQLQDDGSGHMNVVAAEYEEGSEEEEEEPYEREFYDDDDGDDDEPETEVVDPCDDTLPEGEKANGEEPCDGATPPEEEDASEEEPFDLEFCDEDEDGGEQDSFHAEPFTDKADSARHTYRKRLYDVDRCDDLLAREELCAKKRFSAGAVQAVKKEQNKQEVLKRALRKGCSNDHKVLPATDEMEMKPFKKRLSVRFATDVSCYTYNTESFGAGKLEKRKAQFDDQDKHLGKRQEHTLPLSQEGGKLKEVDNTNLYVGNLPASVGSHKLIELFLPFGRIVRSKVADECFTGLSKGYGFVKYDDPHSATAAINRMNGRLVDGKILEVRVAGVPPSGSNPSIQSVSETYSQPSEEIDMSSLYVRNLSLSMTKEELLQHFLPFGKIIDAKVPRDYATGLNKGYGFVRYSNSHEAANAIIHLNGHLVEGKKMEVRVSGVSPALSNSAVESHTDARLIKEIDMANLYVCNIPTSIDTKKLIEIFLPFGKITHARVAAHQGTYSGKGRYGFVKFADSQCAAEAITLMDGALVEGETLVVRVAGLSSSASSPAVHGLPIPSPEINKSRIYITNLPRSTNADMMVKLFVPFGQISKVVMNLEYSLVYYADVASAVKAIKHMDGYMIGGKRLVVRRSDSCPTDAAGHTSTQSLGKEVKEIDMANVFVGRIPSTVNGDQLVELFRPFGQIVQVRVFQHQGYGMFRFNDPFSAAAAIDHMNGYQIGGSALVVRVAGLPNPGDFSAATDDLKLQMPGNEGRQIDMANLYVCHLPLYITTEKLIEIFLPCGQITQARVVTDRYTGISKGFGFVRFADTYSAAVALTHMNGYPLEGHILEVRIAGVHPSDMGSYMTQLYSQFTYPDPSTMVVGIPTSYWPYYGAESVYSMSAENQGQGTASATDAASQTSQQEGLPESVSASSIADKDCPSMPSHAADSSRPQSSAGWAGPPGFESHAVCSQPPSVGWAGPPGFEPHAIPKKEPGTAMNPSQPCSKVHFAQSEGGQKRRSIV
ncbi:probable RNA-binding protein 19 isoform X2 [Brachypodium distachyon]|uniref:RRM domain-containing protein n=2 Tax=Brachypodium distachyon TaxID=15368 RepID=I1J3G9_BRADI|nr:probable RNA-binding protein 19 isoform X2 [Brachypodium distachyon]XP_024311749.1 probable RNA-binding protein 19 isoform X2 [Brachypodium distachyon]KQJ85350.1 hypothetical protein BRADI_5g26510v3 [Brachypodium distachyon]KQJ85351.1 hypothetical protein BRADI_5g26510v3 [Brachypodium distachyon]PNT62162.1 hypothetical protein BRADI_5g26510v3 [Brachypodium distachyon]PNT62163.1 hypothetical protein BRADI_5g26510v3 [Brachypodium distachyon]PNT62164.1 hypothetical protein BRADI_5g26510v3 [Br|eukprot:XP_010240625.1 probable RNA-binding protein 19 isoform X2 [Brachypodium distachyon]